MFLPKTSVANTKIAAPLILDTPILAFKFFASKSRTGESTQRQNRGAVATGSIWGALKDRFHQQLVRSRRVNMSMVGHYLKSDIGTSCASTVP